MFFFPFFAISVFVIIANWMLSLQIITLPQKYVRVFFFYQIWINETKLVYLVKQRDASYDT